VPSCSKASRGLFVLLSVGRIFTANSISPSNGSRQLGTRWTFHARHQLSDKVLRYHRTVIVTAAVHRGFNWKQYLTIALSQLTFRHWAGFSLYTSSFEFAQTCVFVKQSIPILSLRLFLRRGGHIPKVRPAGLPNSLNHFLSLSLVYSTSSPVSVIGTNWSSSSCGAFLGTWSHASCTLLAEHASCYISIKHIYGFASKYYLDALVANSIKAHALSKSVPPQVITNSPKDWNINQLSIGYA